MSASRCSTIEATPPSVAADDPSVPGRILEVGGDQAQRRAGAAVGGDQFAQRRRAQGRQVAVDDQQHRARVDRACGLHHRVAGAVLFLLQDEAVDAGVGGACSTRSAWWPTTTSDRSGTQPAGGIQHVEQHRPTGDRMQQLDRPGAHARAHAGSECQHVERSTPGGHRYDPAGVGSITSMKTASSRTLSKSGSLTAKKRSFGLPVIALRRSAAACSAFPCRAYERRPGVEVVGRRRVGGQRAVERVKRRVVGAAVELEHALAVVLLGGRRRRRRRCQPALADQRVVAGPIGQLRLVGIVALDRAEGLLRRSVVLVVDRA